MSYTDPRKSLRPSFRETLDPSYRGTRGSDTPRFQKIPGPELISKLKEHDILIDRKLLLKPDPKAIIELCEKISILITGKHLADFSDVDDEEIRILGEIKPYKDSLILLRFSAHM